VLGFAIIGIKESENVTVTSNIFIAGAKLSFYFFVYGILEEMGWRVFLQNQLDFLNQYIKYLIIGVLWFVWHLNFGLTTPNIIFFFLLIFASWGIGKIGDKTKSVLAVGAFHTLYNLFSVDYFESTNKLIVLALSVMIWVSYIMFYDKVIQLMKIDNQ
jgi:membrane protease YdiL (CAAX protease family)